MGFWDSLIPSAGVNTNLADPFTTGYGGQAGGLASGLGQYNLGGKNMGQFQGLTQAGVANPFAGGYQQGAGVAGGMGQQAGLGQFGAGGNLMALGQSFDPSIASLLQMGFDPQQSLYARTQQQVRDQAAAQQATSGVGGTPYGAGLMNQANQNFNIDWQNQQLQRALAGAQGAGGLAQTSAGLQGAGANLQNMGIGTYLQGAAQPYQTYGQINQNQLGLLNQAADYGIKAAQIPQMQVQDLSNLASNQAKWLQGQEGIQLQQAQQEFNQAQGLGQDIAGLATMGMGGMTGFMGGMGMGGMGGMGGAGMMGYPGMGGFGGAPGGWGNMGQFGGMSPWQQFGYGMGNMFKGWGAQPGGAGGGGYYGGIGG